MLKSRSRLRLVVVQVMVLVVVRDPARPALVHPGRRRRRLPGGGAGEHRPRHRGRRAARADRRRAGPSAGRQPHVVGRHRRPRRARPSSATRPRTRCCARLADTLGPAARTSSSGVPRPAARTGAAKPPMCWNGSPYEPVPVAEDVTQSLAASILEQSEDFPGISAESRKVRAYPSPFGINAAHVLGYNSPITEDELDAAEDAGRVGQPAVGRRPCGPGERVQPLPQRSRRRPRGVGRLDGPGDRATAAETEPEPGDTLVTSIDAKVQSVVEKQLEQTILTARKTFDPVTGTQLRRRLRRCGRDGRHDRPTWSRWRATRRTTPTSGSAGSARATSTGSTTRRAATPLLARATQGQFAPGSTFKPFMTAGALTHGYSPATGSTARRRCRSATASSRTTSPAPTACIDFAKALQVSCNTFFYRVGYAHVAEVRRRPRRRQRQGPAGRDGQGVRLRHARPASTCPARSAGRIADRHWKLSYWKANKDYYCKLGEEDGERLHPPLRPRVLRRRLRVPRRRRGQLLDRPGRHGASPRCSWRRRTPRSPTAARSGSRGSARRSCRPSGTLVKRIKPQKASRVPGPGERRCATSTRRCSARRGPARRRGGSSASPSTRCRSAPRPAAPRSTASSRRRGWRRYDKQYVVVMMVSQGGTGSGTSGPRSARSGRRCTASHGNEGRRARTLPSRARTRRRRCRSSRRLGPDPAAARTGGR